MLDKVRIEKAVGMVLAHDVTEIRKGEFKGRAFRKGHVIREADICHLQRLGKRHLYVVKMKQGYMHENDAAVAMANAICGDGVTWHGEPKEGKILLVAAMDGLFKVEVAALTRVNMLGEVMCASRHNNFPVKKGDNVAAARAIPLIIKKEIVDEAVRIAQSVGGVFRVRPLKKAKVGIIITGHEVFTRLIKDQFEPILQKKINRLGSETIGVALAPDDEDVIAKEIKELIEDGADIVLTTGGMSVDPDDVTRRGIQKAGGTECIYGASVIPGAMFMIAYVGSVPVLGIPACGIYHEVTIFDLLFPRILAGERIERREIAAMGHGGLCLNCPDCRYPVCPFGKGS